MNVLVIDDDEDSREVVQATLRAAGMEVALAASGLEGIARAVSHRPDVILLDGMMPGMDGAQTLALLKAQDGTRDIPVVLLSACADGRGFLAQGAAAVVAKPFDPAALAARLRGLLAGARAAPAATVVPLDALRASFVRNSHGHLDTAHGWLAALRATPGDEPSLRQLMRLFHNLAGMGSSHGLRPVTVTARTGEVECLERLRTRVPPTTAEIDGWQGLLDTLRQELSAPPQPVSGAEPPADSRGLVLVVSADDLAQRQLIPLLEAEGFAIRGAASAAEARVRLAGPLPAALIVDAHLPDGSGLELVAHVRATPGGDAVAIVVTSQQAAFLDRVDAVTSGADGYFEEPLDWKALLRRLEQVLEAGEPEPTTVLSVEDDPEQAAYVRSVLEAAGHTVVACADPRQLLALLEEHTPDVVLMDILLPGVSGYDLVRTLRQDERWLTLPVLFLTTEGQVQSRWRSTRVGGDDLLVKPVLPAMLLSAVATRIERARSLRQLLSLDGLTRLLTHSAFCAAAQATMSRVTTPSRLLAWVMIDVDHFKHVNDRFGHPVGDRVLASLAGLLKRRLRLSGQVGRYGGEEFAILVEDLPEADVVQLVERLLAEFGAIRHRDAGGGFFSSTFSAGVAMLHPPMTLDAWKTAADNALYAAKAAGRNRVLAGTGGTS